MKSASGWTPLEIACANCETWNAEYRRKKECNVCKDTRLVFGKTNSGNGSNSSGFLGLPGGGCGNFGSGYSAGHHGWWWSASEESGYKAFGQDLHNGAYGYDLMIGFGYAKDNGLSVRCVKD
jgi:uncharacterized protein (TIGR02145 family)